MIGVSEVNLGIDSGFAQGIQQINSKGKWIAVLLGDFVKAAEVDT